MLMLTGRRRCHCGSQSGKRHWLKRRVAEKRQAGETLSREMFDRETPSGERGMSLTELQKEGEETRLGCHEAQVLLQSFAGSQRV